MIATDQTTTKNNKLYLILIGILSVVVPLLVAFLFFGNNVTKIEGLNVAFLPHLNAVMNSATFVCLLLGFVMIKQKKEEYHRVFMLAAFMLSSIFLISYVIYHNNAPSTSYGGIGIIRYIYFFLLITHIILSVVVVPLVLLAIYYAWTRQIIRHKKIVRWTFPVWSYVAASGVIVYWMISPYYL